jgi:hypothetical protein
MGKPYSQDLRERVIAAVDTGTGAYAAAPMFRVSVSYNYKALGRRRATGEVTGCSAADLAIGPVVHADPIARAARAGARAGSVWCRRAAARARERCARVGNAHKIVAFDLEKTGDIPHTYSAACIVAAFSFAISASARQYSTGITLRNSGRYLSHCARISAARLEPV